MEQEQRATRLAKNQQRQRQSCDDDYSLSQDAIYKVFTYLNSNSLYASDSTADKLDDDDRSVVLLQKNRSTADGQIARRSSSSENSMLYAEIGAIQRDRDGADEEEDDDDDDDDEDDCDETADDEGKVLLDNDDDDENDYEKEKDDKERETRYILEEMKYSDARRAVCSVCRYSLGRAGAGLDEDFERALLCSDGHLLCHRCVRKLAVQSDTNCLLCSVAESRASMSSASLPAPPSNDASKTTSKCVKNNIRSSSSSSSSSDSDTARGRLRGGMSEALASRAQPVCPNGKIATRSASATPKKKQRSRRASRGPRSAQSQQQQQTQQQQQQQPQHRYGTSSAQAAVGITSSSNNGGSRSMINAQTLAECSRRPIQCPRLDCAVNVAFSALTNHFMFDHPEVPILGVDPGERSTFIFDFDDLVDDSSRCLALLLVSNKLSGPAARQFNGMHVHPEYKNRLPLPLLAARLASCYGSSSSAEVQNCSVGAEAIVHRSIDDVVIAWVAGLDIGSSANVTLLRYSVQAFDIVNNEESRSVTYTGPINSLRTAQKPREVFLTGDCVILHAGFIRHITSRCRNININVIIH